MAVDPNLYTHSSDQAALQALKAIPGFTPLLKAFMNTWSERICRIENMATNLRVSEKQLPHYYRMLPPICEKLGIEVPELYFAYDMIPDIYTYGDAKPFIVVTSGLIKNLPEHLIPTVLARECGHIACRHVLYSTMGRMILNGGISLLGLGDLVSFPLKAAFHYWMRCSEFSADRAAAICDGSGQNVLELCAFFAGYHKRLQGELNIEAFLEQAAEYKALVDESALNKSLEFLMYNDENHPLNALRAYECNLWSQSENFSRLLAWSEGDTGCVPVSLSSKAFVGKTCIEVRSQLEAMGFQNTRLVRSTQPSRGVAVGQVLGVYSDGQPLEQGSWLPMDAPLMILYYELPTGAELQAAHPGQVQIPNAPIHYIGMPYAQALRELEEAGFTCVTCQGQHSQLMQLLRKEGSVTQITVGGRSLFEKGQWLPPHTPIQIIYHI